MFNPQELALGPVTTPEKSVQNAALFLRLSRTIHTTDNHVPRVFSVAREKALETRLENGENDDIAIST